jgi:hypothetical protein
VSARIRSAHLQDLEAIDRLFQSSAHNGVASKDPLRWPQFPSVRLWFLVSRTISSILPLASQADYLYVYEDDHRIQGFVQAEGVAGVRHAWQILNLCLPPSASGGEVGPALLDHLFGEGLKRGVTKYFVRIPVDDPILEVFRGKRFLQYATEHVLFAENVDAAEVAPLPGIRGLRSKDLLALYLLYRSITPKAVATIEGPNFQEWRANFHQGWLARVGRAGHQHVVLDQGSINAWIGLAAGSSTRPTTLGLLTGAMTQEQREALVDFALGQAARRSPGPVWTNLREYDAHLMTLLKRRGFETLASQALLVRELPIKVKVKSKEKGLVPQFG